MWCICEYQLIATNPYYVDILIFSANGRWHGKSAIIRQSSNTLNSSGQVWIRAFIYKGEFSLFFGSVHKATKHQRQQIGYIYCDTKGLSSIENSLYLPLHTYTNTHTHIPCDTPTHIVAAYIDFYMLFISSNWLDWMRPKRKFVSPFIVFNWIFIWFYPQPPC